MRWAYGPASLLAAGGMAIAAGAPAEAADIAGVSRIEAVTVFPSGAEITRKAKVRVPAGEHTVILADLPIQTVGNSVRVEGRATGTLVIGSVDTRRASVPRTDAAQQATARKRLEDEIERARDARARVAAETAAAEAQKTLIKNLAAAPLHPPAQGGGAPPDWRALLTLIGTSLAEVERTGLEAGIRLRDADRTIADLERKLGELAPGPLERTEVKVFVSAAAELEADLTVRYQVAQASWTPLYDARLATGGRNVAPKLLLTRRAAITQRSGEPWENIAVTLSTTRPSAGSAAPELRTMTVDFEPDRPPPVAMAPPPAQAVRASRSAGLASDDAEGRAKADAPRLEAIQQESARIETAPFQALFQVPGALTVPNTGEPKRVVIDEAALEPTLLVRAVPKQEAKAYLYAKAAMPRTTPYLPGQVSLFRDQTFVGTGRLPQLAPGEEHELGFGADDNVRVRHAILEEKRGETGLITSSRTDQRNFRLSIKSTHERQIAITVLDQIPVSLNQDIKVELTGRNPPTRRDVDDKRGVLAWDDKLAPDEEKTIEFGYRITWPAGKPITYGR